MDEVDRRSEVFRAQAAASVRAKLDALLDLERLRDPRIVPFLLEVLDDQRESAEVRVHVLRRLRNGDPVPDYRAAIADAILRVLAERSIWMSRSTCAIRHSRRCSRPDRRRRALRSLSSYRATRRSGVLRAVSCLCGGVQGRYRREVHLTE